MSTAIFFSLLEIGLFPAMLRRFGRADLKTLLLFPLSAVPTMSLFLAAVLIFSCSNHLAADFVIVLSGIGISGMLLCHINLVCVIRLIFRK